MYIPKQFEEPRVDVIHGLIRAKPLATVVTLSTSGLSANHIPLYLSESPLPFGALRGHVARANPIVNDLRNNIESLAVFHGPKVYISPSWYATKKESGKVVPTWNYVVAHAYGVLRVVDNPAWLLEQLEDLTSHNEASFSEPWTVSDLPQEYIEKMIAGIVGIEMVITKLLGKWKVSQNQPPHNQASVAAGLRASGLSDAVAMASLVDAGAKIDR